MKEASIYKSEPIYADEDVFYKRVVAEYLRFGSVDEVMLKSKNLPVSYQGTHHILNRWGIVKAAGPNTQFSHTLEFLSQLVERKLKVEELYRRMPPSFKEKTSVQTLYRIVSYIRQGLTRRAGTALVVTQEGDDSSFLVGNDVSVPRTDVGKPYGSLSLPMGFSRRNEPRELSILRVLQREVLSVPTVEKAFPSYIIPDKPQPIMNIAIADVSVNVYRIVLPKDIVPQVSSFVLDNLRFEGVYDIETSGNVRAGVTDIVRKINDQEIFLESRGADIEVVAELNKILLAPSFIQE